MRFTSRGYETPGMATDAVLLHDGQVLLVRRGRAPAKDQWALPGGFVEVGERTEEAVLRELLEETAVEAEVEALVGVYSDPGRDPRGHIVSITYRCRPADGAEVRPEGGDDAAEARWWPLNALPEMAFDHRAILKDALSSD